MSAPAVPILDIEDASIPLLSASVIPNDTETIVQVSAPSNLPAGTVLITLYILNEYSFVKKFLIYPFLCVFIDIYLLGYTFQASYKNEIFSVTVVSTNTWFSFLVLGSMRGHTTSKIL
jgi:hypothetical protein